MIDLITSTRLVFLDSQASNAKEGANAIDSEKRPVHVRNEGEEEVAPQIEQLESSRDLREADAGEIGEHSTTVEWDGKGGPPGEWLLCQVEQDDLGGHATKDEADGDGEEDESVLLEESGIW